MRVSVSPLAVSAPVAGTTVVMTPDMRFLELDEVGADIWEMLTAGSEVDEIAQELGRRYVVDVGTAAEDVTRFIGYLAEEGVVSVSE